MDKHRQTFLHSLVLLIAAGFLVLFAETMAFSRCWFIFIPAAVFAWPIWAYRTEYILFQRRLMLSGAGQPEGRVRALFWKGHIAQVLQAVLSLVLAWLLLALVSGLHGYHALVLVINAALVAFAVGPVVRILGAEFKEQYVAIIARRWPLLFINGTLLTIVFVMLDFFVVGSMDTRHLSWHETAEYAFKDTYEASGCVIWGAIAGAISALEAVAWHMSELLIPQLPSMASQVMAWFVFLVRSATVAWLFSVLLLGEIIILDKWAERRHADQPVSLASWSFFITIFLMALAYFYIATISLDDSILEKTGDLAIECQSDEFDRSALSQNLDDAINSERISTRQVAESEIDDGMDRIFNNVEEGVEQYLDWYYTVIGEYQRLAAAVTSDISTLMREEMEEHLFVNSNFAAEIDALDKKVEGISTERFSGIGRSLGSQLEEMKCNIGQVDLSRLKDIDNDMLRASTAITSGAGASIVATKVLAEKTSAAVVAKFAAKKSFQTGVAIATKTLAKKGTSVALSAGAGTAICAPTGFVAVLCGVTAGIVTWFTVDKGLVEIDEALHRDEMRLDLLAVLREQKEILGTQLKEKHRYYIDELAASVHRFVPAEYLNP